MRRWLPLLAALLALPALAQTPATGQKHPAPAATSPAATVRTPSATPAATPTRTQAVPAPSGPPLIDVNSADEKALDSLPGVGPVRAKAIVANRPYLEKQDLVTKKAIPANVFAQIQDKIALVNINTATAAQMAKILPNVGPVRSQKIVDNRPYSSITELVTKGALTNGVYSGVANLVTTGQ